MQSLIAERAALRPVLGLLALRLVKRRAYETLAFRSLAGWAETASPHALDGSLRRAMKRQQRIEHDLGRILRQVQERRLYRELGFVSFERYVEERVDISPRTARRWVQMARLGPAGSAVAGAFRDGLLTPKQASLVSEVVPPAQQPEAIVFAQGVTLRRLEDELGARDTARDAISFTAPPEAANVFLLALEAARRESCRHWRAGSPRGERGTCQMLIGHDRRGPASFSYASDHVWFEQSRTENSLRYLAVVRATVGRAFTAVRENADDVLELVAVEHLLVLRRARRRPAGSASRPSLPSQP